MFFLVVLKLLQKFEFSKSDKTILLSIEVRVNKSIVLVQKKLNSLYSLRFYHKYSYRTKKNEYIKT